MATAKTVNYTPEQTAAMVADYTANPTAETVSALASALGKTTRSIVAKLSREKVYKAKEYTAKNGEKPVKKDDLADKLSGMFGLTEAEADSLTKANKTALLKILAKFEE
jgi:formiminotetrahydrofolate cyclodeaminase